MAARYPPMEITQAEYDELASSDSEIEGDVGARLLPYERGKSEIHGSKSASERAKLLAMKAQMEQQIQALEKQIHLEEIMMLARSHRYEQQVKASSSLAVEPAEKPGEAPDPHFESGRLMLEACHFAQLKKEHPLETWTAGSLPNLARCSTCEYRQTLRRASMKL
ncbi:hypothetical protein OS493_029058 [Desmophyllum pertusum]|uniref:Uncharacterized protein n=1 Tax=Desmophyllum pertusum TaxID=174260 RepID=A0A9W9YK49_9CNID|nr:hypothetical protein OS493_029058 [Desmophyllum pertusum]